MPPVADDVVAAEAEAEPVPECDAEALAAALSQGMSVFDYETSQSPADLFMSSTAVVRGQLLWATPELMDRIEGTNLAIKHRVTATPGLNQIDMISVLWTPATIVPEGFGPSTDEAIGVSFLAFVGDQIEPTGAWPVQLEGFWIACDDSSPAVPVLLDPREADWTGFKGNEPTLETLWDAAVSGDG